MKTLKVRYSDMVSSKRLDGGFHLSEGTLYLKIIRSRPYTELQELSLNIFTAGRRKRVYTEEKFGYPYLSNSDVIKQSPLDNCKYNSKKLGYDEASFLKRGMIVTGRVGAVGQTAYITSELEKYEAMGSDNIIRIVAKDKEKSGFIYAFLVSKYGQTLLRKLATGGVQPYITEDMLNDMPVPNLDAQKQIEIHQLIEEASELRVVANSEIKSLREDINKRIGSIYKLESFGKSKFSHTSILQILKDEKRIDAPYNVSVGRELYNKIRNLNHRCLSAVAKVEHPILFGKKQLKGTAAKGNCLYKSSSMMQIYPETDFMLSVLKAEKYSKLKVEEGWILISRTGTVGNVVRISKRLAGVYIDDHMIRVIPQPNFSGLIYLFLTSKLGKELIMFQKYGTVQDVINSNYIERIPLPEFLFEQSYLDKLEKSVELAFDRIDKAAFLEKQAVGIIENEIGSWDN